MKFLIYGDLQATDGDSVCFHDPSTSLQHWRVERFFKDIEKLATEHGCEGIIDLGDTTDDRSSIPLTTIDVIGRGLKRLEQFEENHKLIGNHEQFLRDTSVDNRQLFAHTFQVHPGNLILKMHGVDHFFCSYPASYKELADWLSGWTTPGPRVLFGHFQVKGTRTNSGISLDGIPLELLSHNFDLVVLGHIHASHALADNVSYLGSPFQQDWGEQGQKKYVGIYDTSTVRMELVEMTGYPVYRTVTYPEFLEQPFDSEDRYRVQLASHEETELFFQHPQFKRGEPVYIYDASGESGEELKVESDWSFEAVTRRYMDVIVPEKVGIDLDPDEMVSVAKNLAGL